MFIVAGLRRLAIHPELPSWLYRTPRSAAEDIYRLAFKDTPTAIEDRIHWLPYVFNWPQVVRISAVEPWPALEIEWRHQRIRDHRRFEPKQPWFRTEVTDELLDWETAIVALFERVDELELNVPLERGWVDAAHVDWVDAEWPREESTKGSYRTSAREQILATRAKPSPGEFLISWLAAGPRQPWQATPREVVVTREYVHARLAGGRTACVPLNALRLRRGEPKGSVVYVFGRRTVLVLPFRKGCEVRALLDKQLGLAEV